MSRSKKKRMKNRKRVVIKIKKKKKGKKEAETGFLTSHKVCHSPKWVQIGKHSIYLCGSRDFDKDEEGCRKEIAKLDVFFGLDSYQWRDEEKVEPKRYVNSYLESLRKRFFEDEDVPDNIMVAHISDRGTSGFVYYLLRKVIEEGKKVGFGCMGGHGRTGWLAAKLIKYFEGCTGDEAVKRIRSRLCEECVESEAQVKDLGCEKMKGSDKLVSSYGVGSWLSGYESRWPSLGVGSNSFPMSGGHDKPEDFMLPSFARESNLLPQVNEAPEVKNELEDTLVCYGD